MVFYKRVLQSLALPLLASAATTTTATAITADCNPVSSTGCPADPALATSFADDFTEESSYFDAIYYSDRIAYSDEGVSFTLAERYDNPALKSNFYIMFGKVEVILKAANGTGIVSSFYLQSDDLDEIDLEWLGGDTTQVQSNYFSKGNTTTHDRGGYHTVESPQTEFHNYTIDWSEEETVFYIDGTVVRTISNDTSSGYPQSPMYIVAGLWAGGDPDNSAGTIEWAGGETDYTQAPFVMYIKNVIVTDYSTGSEYKYTDQTGDWTSIEAVDGSVNGRVSTAEEEFAILADGGVVSSGSTTSTSTTKSSTTESTSKTSSSTHGQLESSSSRVSSVYTSSANSLVTRSDSSTRSTTVLSSTSEETTKDTTSSSAKSASTLTTSLSSSASSTTGSVSVANNAFAIAIGESGIKALIVSILMTVGMLFV